jgi:hypothetical protein
MAGEAENNRKSVLDQFCRRPTLWELSTSSLFENVRGCIEKFPDWVFEELRRQNSQNSDTTAPSGRQLYHLQFSLQAASPESFGYILVKLWCLRSEELNCGYAIVWIVLLGVSELQNDTFLGQFGCRVPVTRSLLSFRRDNDARLPFPGLPLTVIGADNCMNFVHM